MLLFTKLPLHDDYINTGHPVCPGQDIQGLIGIGNGGEELHIFLFGKQRSQLLDAQLWTDGEDAQKSWLRVVSLGCRPTGMRGSRWSLHTLRFYSLPIGYQVVDNKRSLLSFSVC